jgi:hypothetical protein
MGHKRKRRSFETPRKRAAPQDDGRWCQSFPSSSKISRITEQSDDQNDQDDCSD